MLQFFHKHQTVVYGIVAICAVTLAFSGFGMNFFNEKRSQYAIKIDSYEVPSIEFEREVRLLEQRYRANFKNLYDQIAPQLNLRQQVLDRKVSEVLLEREADKLGLISGGNEFKIALQTQVFPSGYSADYYRSLLAHLGMSQDEFEAGLRRSVVRSQFAALLKDASRPSRREAAREAMRKATTYEVALLEADPEKILAEVSAPTDEAVKSYYDDNEQEFQVPPKVLYDFVVIRPSDLMSKVEVSDDEVDIEYTDNIQKYTTPEAVKARHIQFNFPQESDPAKMAAVKEKAEKALERARAGEKFESLVLEYSDDLISKTTGGDLGWVSKGTREAAFDAAVFKVTGEGIADLVATSYGYHVVKVEGHREAEPKKLEEVREEIRAALRKKNAPSFAIEKARDIYDSWTKAQSTLADAVKGDGLTVTSTAHMLAKDEDPDATLSRLTASIMEYPEDQQQLLIELPGYAVLVQVKERKDLTVASLADSTAQIVTKLKKKAAQEQARAKMNELLTLATGDKAPTFAQLAKDNKLALKEEKDVGASPKPDSIASSGEVFERVQATYSPAVIGKVFEVRGKYYLARVNAIRQPSEKIDAQTIASTWSAVESARTEALMTSIINHLKAGVTITQRPGLLAR